MPSTNETVQVQLLQLSQKSLIAAFHKLSLLVDVSYLNNFFGYFTFFRIIVLFIIRKTHIFVTLQSVCGCPFKSHFSCAVDRARVKMTGCVYETCFEVSWCEGAPSNF